MTATADEIDTIDVEADPCHAVHVLLGILTATRDRLGVVILTLTQQRDQLNRRISQAEAILANGS